MMRNLREATGDMIILGTEHGLEAVYLKVLQATNPVRFHMKQGARRSTSTTAVGRALLSTKPNKEIGQIVRRLNAEQVPEVALPSLPEIPDAANEGHAHGFSFTKITGNTGAVVIRFLKEQQTK